MPFTPQNFKEQAMLDLLEMQGLRLMDPASLDADKRVQGYTGYGVLWRGEHYILVESIREAFECFKEKLI